MKLIVKRRLTNENSYIFKLFRLLHLVLPRKLMVYLHRYKMSEKIWLLFILQMFSNRSLFFDDSNRECKIVLCDRYVFRHVLNLKKFMVRLILYIVTIQYIECNYVNRIFSYVNDLFAIFLHSVSSIYVTVRSSKSLDCNLSREIVKCR